MLVVFKGTHFNQKVLNLNLKRINNDHNRLLILIVERFGIATKQKTTW